MSKRLLVSVVLLIVTLFVSVLYVGAYPPTAFVAPRQTAQLAPSSSTIPLMTFTPNNVSDTSKTSGTVAYTVNLYNSSAINEFSVRITYNYNVLNGQSMDYSSNVLGTNAQVNYYCLDGSTPGVPPPSPYCDDHDNQGVIHLDLYLLGNVSVTPPSTGILLKITFKVVGQGFSQLHLLPTGVFGSKLLCALCGHNPKTPAPDLPLTTQDGYFNNILCGPRLCKPPATDFTFSPNVTAIGRPVTFNANTSKTLNPNAVIRQYHWDFGDDLPPSTTTSNVTSHSYRNVGNYTVTLTATDSYGIEWSKTRTVPIIAVYIHLIAGQVKADPQFGVHPGTIVKLTANVINNGSITLSSRVTISVENLILGNQTGQTFTVGPFHQSVSLSATWNTSGYVPRVYRVTAFITEPSGANSTRGNVGTAYVQLIEPVPAGTLSLSLAETTGLGIVVIAAIGFTVTRLRRKPSYADEPL